MADVNQIEQTEPVAIHPANWDRRYEITAVTLLSIGFALVGLDRWIIAPLLPSIMKDLHLNYQDAGNIIGVLALSWGVFAVLMGRLSDTVGRRRILIPSLIIFSLMSCISGLATGLLPLLLARGVMGATEGAFLPACTAATAEASSERRRGFNQGIQLSTFAWVGLGFGPLIATGLLDVFPSWRWVFCIVGVPGLLTAIAMIWVIREPPHLQERAAHRQPVRWGEMFHSRNVPLAMALILCAMGCVFVLSGMLPSYLSDYVHLPAAQSAGVLSAIGFGGGIGQFAFAALSDHLGRKPVAFLCFSGGLVFLIWFSRIGLDATALFWTLFGCAGFVFGILAIMTGPVPTEAVSRSLTASAIGIVSGAGEIFGGGIAPSAAGWVAQHFGIDKVLRVSMVGLLLGLALSLLLRETAPRRMARATAQARTSRS
jgi:MFS family permease